MKKLFQSNLFIFLLIVLVQMAYKMAYLDLWGFWHDEAFRLYFSQQHWGHIKHISEWDMNPPLYYYFLWIWQNLFGVGEYAIRFSSVLLSALSAGMLYLLCARNFTKGCGWLAVLFFSVYNEAYFFSHEVGSYSLVIFLVLCSSYCFLELLRERGWIIACVLGVLNFGLVYTSYASVLLVVIQLVLVMFQFNRSLFKYFGTAFGITVLIAALRFTSKTIALVLNNGGYPSNQKVPLQELTETFYNYFNGPDLFFIFLFAAIVVLVFLVRNKEWETLWLAEKIQLSYIWLSGFGLAIIYYLVCLFAPPFSRHHIIFAAPFVHVSLAWFISRAAADVRYPLIAITGMFLIFSTMRIDLKTPRSMDYRGALHLVKSLQRYDTPVLVETRDVEALFSYYYDRDIFRDYGNVQRRLREKGIYFVNNTNDIKNADLSNASRVVLTQTFEDLNPANEALLTYLSANFPQRVSTKFYRGITITVYSK